MQTALALIGAIFLIFSVIVFSVYLKEDEARAKEAAWGIVVAVWALIGFGIGSWLISLLLGGLPLAAGEALERRGLPSWLAVLAPAGVLVAVGLLGAAIRKRRRHR